MERSEEPDEAAVLAANERFYQLFDARDCEGMGELWAEGEPGANASCLHPGWPPVFGREAVLETWRRILTGPAPPAIRCAEARARLAGGDAAIVICREELADGSLLATNVFVRQSGHWRLVHHQAGPAPEPVAAPSGPLH